MIRVQQILQVLAAGVIITALSCSTVRVETDYDPETDFGSLQTYAWMPDPPAVSSDPLLHNSLLDSRVRSAVDRALAAKGIRKVSAEEASFLVNYYISLEHKIRVDSIPVSNYGYRGAGWRGGLLIEARVHQYDEGTLILDVVDPQKNELLWRGSGSTQAGKTSTPEARKKKIDEIVSKLLATFPPNP
ncbi:MAG: DUF4136 domain-containing protein [Deltaproteobacteria bacterium]|nr:DUF4136 domain-containing protein [Deltaproteobacteria bacterium]